MLGGVATAYQSNSTVYQIQTVPTQSLANANARLDAAPTAFDTIVGQVSSIANSSVALAINSLASGTYVTALTSNVSNFLNGVNNISSVDMPGILTAANVLEADLVTVKNAASGVITSKHTIPKQTISIA